MVVSTSGRSQVVVAGLDAALQVDLRTLASGRYNYELNSGVLQLNNGTFSGSTSTSTGQILHVNRVNSAFGSGWSLTGLQEIVENEDGSVLIIDGDGSELLFELSETGDGTFEAPPGDFSILERLQDGTFRRTLTDQTVFSFDERNQLALIRDRNNNEIQYVYNDAGQLIEWIDPVGLTTTFIYTGDRITSITDPTGRVTQLEYDEAGNLIRITDPDNTSRQFEYDTEHHLTAEVDKRGNREETFYDFAGRADRAIQKDGSVIEVDPAQVNGLYEPDQTIDPLNAPLAFQIGDVAESTYVDANGNTITYTLDQMGQIISVADEVGALPTIQRNEDNLITQQTDARGNSSIFTYDDRGNLIAVQDPLSFGGEFVDISETGTLVPGIQNSDDASQLVTLPFEFTFFDQAYTQLGISTNGVLSFDGTNTTFTNFPLDSGGTGLNNLPSILPFWDDFETRTDEGAIASIYTQTLGQPGNRRFVIQWHQLEAFSEFSETGDVTFQAILTEGTNAIQFNYLDVQFEGGTDVEHGEGRSATVGIWNSPEEFQQFSFNETSLMNGLSLIVTEDGIIEGSGSGGVPRQFTYDSGFNQLTSVIDELGRQTLFDIDPNNGNILSTTQVIGAVGGDDDIATQFTYTDQGLVDTITDPLGRVTDNDYDVFGRLISITFAQGTADEATQQFEYDVTGNQTASIGENGNRTEFEYDALNRITQITEADPDGNSPLTSPTTLFEYDAAGNQISTTDAVGNFIQNEFDVLNRLTRTVDALGNETQLSYDAFGNLTSIVDPLGNETQNSYDARHRLIQTSDPDSGITQLNYDLDNNITSVLDPVGNETTFIYDARDRLIAEIDPLGNSITFEYNAVDSLVGQIDRNDRRTEFEYDDLDRLVSETWIGTDQIVTHSYDKASNLTAISDQFSALSYTYDNRDRVLTIDNTGTPGAPSVVLSYTYDDVGNILSVTDTIDGEVGGTNAYIYDALNRVIEQSQSGNGISDKRVDFAYNNLGQFSSINRYADLMGNQLVTSSTYTYDELNRLTDLSHNNSTTEVAFYNFTYDEASRLIQSVDVDGTTSYTYDDRNQLTAADHTAPTNPDETYTYDANGNRISSSIHGDGYVTGDGNRLLSDGTYNYDYDGEGNRIRRTEIATGNITDYEWDYRNRLIAVINKDSSGTEVQRVGFTYDAFDRRIRKSVDTTPQDPNIAEVTHFIYDRDDVLLDFVEVDGVGGSASTVLDQRYLHGPSVDQVLAQEDREGAITWLLTDHLGTTRDLINNDGLVVNHLLYDSFGRVTSEINSEVKTRYLFTGREFDRETGLQYNRERYYAPEIGRFLSQDPVTFAGGSANLFSYVSNTPTVFSDPLGLSPESNNVARAVQGPSTAFGTMAIQDSIVREGYQRGVGNLDPTDSAGRTLLKQQARRASSPIGRAIAESMRPIGQEATRAGGTASKTNSGVNRALRNAGRLGRVSAGIGVGISIYNIGTAPASQRGRVAAQEGGALAGSLSFGYAGAAAGAAIGGFFGGVGAVPGALIGGLIGSIGGAFLGEQAGNNVFDAFGGSSNSNCLW